MSKTFFSAESRGKAEYQWLKTKYSFSFANYYNPDRMGFGALRVINDDWIAPGAGFSTHPHQNMEIITIPLSGTLAHKDDAGGEGIITHGMVQVMSAGTGVLHSEFNNSKEEPVELFQIWIEPNQYHVKPRYGESQYKFHQQKTESILLVGPQEKTNIWIHQNAYISRISILAGETFIYEIHEPKNGIHLFVVTGTGNVEECSLSSRDALEIINETSVTIKAESQMDILCIEVPV